MISAGLMVLCLWTGMGVCESYQNGVLTDALAAGDWVLASELLISESAISTDATSQLLLGHIAMARGSLNDAAVLFAAVTDSLDLSVYLVWSEALASNYPESPFASYFHGDALARSGRYAEALEALTAAIGLDESFLLALNARGVVHSIVGERSEAHLDWQRVLDLDPSFPDVHANLVVYMIEGGGKRAAAEETLLELLDIAPDFGLAYNSLACVQASGETPDAARDALIRADSLCQSANPYVSANAAELVLMMEDPGELERIAGDVDPESRLETEGRGASTMTGYSLKADVGIIPGILTIGGSMDFSLMNGGVYLSPSSVDITTDESPRRFITNYLLCYPRDMIQGSLN